MFYNETKTIELVEEEPPLVFELIKEGHIQFVDMLLKKKIVDINTCDEAGNNILVRLLKCGAYDVVLNHMGNKDWDVNHQNLDGNTFAHILAAVNYVNVIDIIAKEQKKRKDALVEFEKSGRQDLVNQTNEELAVIKEYLPEELSMEELEKIIEETIKEVNAIDMKDMGKVMQAVKAKTSGRADGKTINEIVKKELA